MRRGVRALWQLVRGRSRAFTDGVIDLYLGDEQGADDEALGIEEIFVFHLCPHGARERVGYVSLRVGESGALYYLGHVGYRVDAMYRGRGYALRALRLIAPFAVRVGLRSAVITTDVDNAASRRVCEKLGCTLERIAPVPAAYRAVCAGSALKCRYIWRAERTALTYERPASSI